MRRRTIFTTLALCVSCLLLTNSASAQNKKTPKETFLEKTVRENPLTIENGIIYGLAAAKIDSFFDDTDSVWIVDEWLSSEVFRIEEVSTDDILAWSHDTLGNVILSNSDANLLSQNRNILPEGVYTDILDNAYLPTLPEKQAYAFLFLADRDYTFQELRIKFHKPQEINGFDAQLYPSDPYGLEGFLHSNPELIEQLMLEKDFLEIFAIGNQDIFQLQTTVSLLTPAGRSKKTYNTSGFASATLTKLDKNSKSIYCYSGLSSKYTHELIVPAGSYVLLTSRSDVSL